MRNTLLLLSVFVASTAGGCKAGARMGAGPAYPTTKTQAAVVDAQVRRDQAVISVTNTSARSFPESMLWLNAQFGHRIPALDPGECVTLDLSAFKNEYGESFRAGGFFATERPEALVLAQIELEEELVGLIVVNGRP